MKNMEMLDANKNISNAMGMDHSHMPISIPKNVKAVGLSLAIVADSMSGYNLSIITQNYQLTPPPENTDMEELMKVSLNAGSGFLQGHAHLYINGEKIQRVYGQYIHLPEAWFKQGTNSVSITLNNHDHRYWTQSERKILATIMLDHHGKPLIKHQFASFPVN